MTLPINVTTRDLNWWAESADGLCTGGNVYLVAVGNEIRLRREGTAPVNGEQTLAVIRRPADEAPAPTGRVIPRIAFSLGTGAPEFLEASEGEQCDAFFTTASAAAKFVYPYYEAQRLLSAEEMAELKKPFRPDVVGIAHYPPSRPTQALPDGTVLPIGRHPLETAFVVLWDPNATLSRVGLSQYAAKLVMAARAAL